MAGQGARQKVAVGGGRTGGRAGGVGTRAGSRRVCTATGDCQESADRQARCGCRSPIRRSRRLWPARPGDHVASRRNLRGRPNMDRERRHGHAIVIKARNWHKAVFTGRIQIRSPYLWLHALRTSFMGPDPDWTGPGRHAAG